MEQNQVFKLNDDEVFILDRSQSKRIAQLKIDRNIEIYSSKRQVQSCRMGTSVL